MFSSLLFQIAILKGNLLEIPRAKDLKEGHAFFLMTSHNFTTSQKPKLKAKSKQKSGKKGRKLRRA